MKQGTAMIFGEELMIGTTRAKREEDNKGKSPMNAGET